MRVEFSLENLNFPESMHDFRVNKIELEENQLVFTYDQVHFSKDDYPEGSEYYEMHKDYKACRVIFESGHDSWVDVKDSTVEIRSRKGNKVTAQIYDIDKFIPYLTECGLVVETLYFFVGNQTVIIEGQLWNENDKAYDRFCRIEVSAETIIYDWCEDL